MSLDLILLIGILLAKAQGIFGPKTPVAVANDSQAKANQAAADAAAAAARGDHATASTKSAEAAEHQKTATTAATAARTPPPWPQVIPAGLPPFPSAAWRPASPVTSAMVSRAFQLLPQLWEHGEGTWKLEKTGDRWAVFRAAHTSPDKKGVVVFTTTEQSAAADSAPSAMAPQAPPTPARPSEIVPASHTTAPASTHPTLRLTTPRTTGPSVVWLQQHLGITADGSFGTGTDAAVRHFQSSKGLTADGIVGPKTWAALGVGQAAAA